MVTVHQINEALARRSPIVKADGKIDWHKNDIVSMAYADMFGRAREYAYASQRPVGILGLTVVTQIGPHWFYGSLRPLRAEQVVEAGLTPLDRSLAALLLDASATRGQPIELSKTAHPQTGDWIYALFRIPQGQWQLSWFEVGFGPAGHRISDDAEALLTDPLREGFRVWLPGAVDACVG